jgi:ankyrin repeat protein
MKAFYLSIKTKRAFNCLLAGEYAKMTQILQSVPFQDYKSYRLHAILIQITTEQNIPALNALKDLSYVSDALNFQCEEMGSVLRQLTVEKQEIDYGFVDRCIQLGCNICEQDGNGITVLHFAAHNGKCKLIDYLLNKDKRLLEIPTLHERLTAIRSAARASRYDATNLLMERGAKIGDLLEELIKNDRDKFLECLLFNP